MEWRGKPKIIRCDNGPEYINAELTEWSKKNGIKIAFIQPGNPQQNAYVGRYNRTARCDTLQIMTELTKVKCAVKEHHMHFA